MKEMGAPCQMVGEEGEAEDALIWNGTLHLRVMMLIPKNCNTFLLTKDIDKL